MSTKSTAIYRVLLREAWQITWQKKSLWIFGLFAGLLSSGGAFEAMLSGLQQATSMGTKIARMSMKDWNIVQLPSILRFFRIESEPLWPLFTIVVLFVLLIIALSLFSQAGLILGIGSPHTRMRDLLHQGKAYVWEIFFLNVLTKTSALALMLITTLPIVLVIMSPSPFASFLFFIHFLLFIPAVIVLYTISILAIIDVVEADRSVLHGLHHAFTIFKKHWLATLEFGFILFSVVLFVGALIVALFSLLSIPYGIIYTSLLLTGSLTLFLITNIILGMLVFIFLFICGSALVTFQYSAWYFFYKRATHRVHGNRMLSKLRRMLVH